MNWPPAGHYISSRTKQHGKHKM